MLDMDLATGSDSLMRALTGVSPKEFRLILPDFGRELERDKEERYDKGIRDGTRQRRSGGGYKGKIRTDAQRLFFILLYFKTYPTFEVLGFFFGMRKKNARRNVNKLAPILEKALGSKTLLPARDARNLSKLLKEIPELTNLLADGTERPVQRKKCYAEQKEDYSGKKKRHTKKNVLITDEDRKILYLSSTKGGRNHDYAMLKEEIPPDTFPKGICVWDDLGFLGMEKGYPDVNVIMPKKKPRGGELTPEEKAWNRTVSSFRVRVEHAIGGIKRFGIVSQVFRNRSAWLCDIAMNICSGLWNLILVRD